MKYGPRRYTEGASEARLLLTVARATQVIESRARLPPGSYHLVASSDFALSPLPPIMQLKERLHGARYSCEGIKKIQDHIHRRSPPYRWRRPRSDFAGDKKYTQ